MITNKNIHLIYIPLLSFSNSSVLLWTRFKSLKFLSLLFRFVVDKLYASVSMYESKLL